MVEHRCANLGSEDRRAKSGTSVMQTSLSRWQLRKWFQRQAKYRAEFQGCSAHSQVKSLGSPLPSSRACVAEVSMQRDDVMFVEQNWDAYYEAWATDCQHDCFNILFQLRLSVMQDEIAQLRWLTALHVGAEATPHDSANRDTTELQMQSLLGSRVAVIQALLDRLPSRGEFNVTFGGESSVEADTRGLMTYHVWGQGPRGGLVLPRTRVPNNFDYDDLDHFTAEAVTGFPSSGRTTFPDRDTKIISIVRGQEGRVRQVFGDTEDPVYVIVEFEHDECTKAPGDALSLLAKYDWYPNQELHR